ncbi:hypothetical protein NMY22_g2531 [Coprinellus aureogranulatus]|nr:hypothetical protein NMY22_g2531 [Coprinellus aureogranulatus]
MFVIGKKPGHGEDLSWTPPDLLPNALTHTGYNAVLPALTLREITMLNFMNTVTDKPEWVQKVFEDDIVEKWKSEAVKLDVPVEDQMTEKMFEYCIQELRYRAQHHDALPNGAIQVFPGAVYKSDSAVSRSIQDALKRAVHPLEDVPEHEKDWHPGSDGKVLDLVHPSLYPLVYGLSKILPIGAPAITLEDCVQRCGEGQAVKELAAPLPLPPHRWARDNEKLRAIITYINNLHPQHHQELYFILEDVIAETIPLWNLSLAPLAIQKRTQKRFHFPRRILYKEVIYDPDPEMTGGDAEHPEPEEREGEPVSVYDDRLDAWYDWCERTRRVVLPEPPEEFVPLEQPEPFSLKAALGNKPMQVIVKLANIELTPEKPEYKGGTCHVEGKMVSIPPKLCDFKLFADGRFLKNEAICASAIYYYSSENISTSSLSFSYQCKEPGWPETSYRQNTTDWIEEVFGLEHEGSPIQTLGSVETREGRLITFPNLMLHQVQPFKLADPTKPGHRKILALFLVDPSISIISTADVPPQRRDWWAEEVVSACGKDGSANWFNRLPTELKNQVFEAVDFFPISRRSAEQYRMILMSERENFVLGHQRYLAATTINLCEH